MEIGNQAQALMGVSGEERKPAHGFSQIGGDMGGNKVDIVDAVIGEGPFPQLGFAQQETQGSDTYCLGPLLRSPRSASILPNLVTYQGSNMGQQTLSMPPKQVLRV